MRVQAREKCLYIYDPNQGKPCRPSVGNKQLEFRSLLTQFYCRSRSFDSILERKANTKVSTPESSSKTYAGQIALTFNDIWNECANKPIGTSFAWLFPGRGYGIYGFVTPICFEKLHNSVQFHHSNSGHSDSASAVPFGPKICANARLGVGCLRGPESRLKFVGIFQMFSVFFERQHTLQRFFPSLGRGRVCFHFRNLLRRNWLN